MDRGVMDHAEGTVSMLQPPQIKEITMLIILESVVYAGGPTGGVVRG
jgi:hypothetical protein